MSFDIVVLKPMPDSALVSILESIGEIANLGTAAEIRSQCDAVLGRIKWSTEAFGLYEAPEGFALEFAIPAKGAIESLHITLHFGSKWESIGSEAFDRTVRRFYEMNGWQAFAVSDNSSLLLGV